VVVLDLTPDALVVRSAMVYQRLDDGTMWEMPSADPPPGTVVTEVDGESTRTTPAAQKELAVRLVEVGHTWR
jgi:hypothetical protein